ncbi:hypothetical protein V5P93_005366 [Actinokineospora auranticolor]|uniref:Uncharacterized protein n=1 Tax=Actinokineospora auranticolor TaxID=155976 RepID=A0A2S6GQZ7_9PSEU|nr:hypothetical protein [Actinokineospora auranticolor]PPK67607.1 hypothetical protein CLV40_107273 [Actinokineospora auranticolor]
MPAERPLAALIDELDHPGPLRGATVLDTIQGALASGTESWQTALADLDAGGDAVDALDLVADAYDLTRALGEATREATEMISLGVDTPTHHFLVAVVPLRRELVRANARPTTQLRRAVALERRGQSRWRGPEGRAAAMVDRDLQLEEVRVTAKTLLDDIADLTTHYTRWRTGR